MAWRLNLNSPGAAVLASAAAVGLLIILMSWLSEPPPGGGTAPPLFVYCGAGIRAPVEAVAKEYERECGVPIHFQYGPSQTLLAQLELSKLGDLYLPGDDSYIELARKKDLIDESAPLARMLPVLAVRKGNPKQIRTLDDLLRPDVRLAQTAPEVTAAGRLIHIALQKTGQWERIKANTTVFKGTVNDVANDLKVGSVDAGFVWDVLVTQYPQLEVVKIAQLAETHALVSAGTLKSSSQPAAARELLRYLAAEDKGLRAFKDHGFEPVDGKLWREPQ
jgi:molybdate transport system substrate-binding protein